ncbi:MAG: zinc-ribbon domain-containing protein, partial [Parafilimonas terrae]|nr:zinc-ribbon domain-containing protein [Parafilimonas terrae]
MQISCPHCSSRYEVPAELFAEDSRMVRCAECRDTWEVESPRRHESAGPTVVPLFGPEIVTEARFGRRVGTPRAAPRPHSRAKLAGSLRRARGAAVFAAMSLSVAALMAGVARKEDVVRALPASAPL